MAAVDTSRDIAAAAGKRAAVEKKAVRAVKRRVLLGLALGVLLLVGIGCMSHAFEKVRLQQRPGENHPL